jgi:hypothetical protein
MITTEQIHFRLFEMPCCGQMLCWVNPRLPSFCPECSNRVLLDLKSGEYTRISDKEATLRMDSEK